MENWDEDVSLIMNIWLWTSLNKLNEFYRLVQLTDWKPKDIKNIWKSDL